MRNILVTDFDGTITENDVYSLVMDHHMPAGAPDIWGAYVRGEINHFEAMKRIMSFAPSDAGGLDRLLAATRPDPGLRDAVERLDRAGWDVVVVSAGSSWYIERIFEQAGVHLPVYSNPGHIEPGRGIVLELPTGSPFFSPETGIDKVAVVRDALARAGRVAFAGDGPPDLNPSLLVEDELRFARGWLAGELKRLGRAWRPFRRWSEIATALGA